MKNKIIIISFIALLLASTALFIMPSDTESFKAENRAKSEMPVLSKDNYFSGEFAADFESYVNDSMAFRSAMTSASRLISEYKGIAPPDGRVIYTNKDIGTETVKKACLLIADGKMMEVFSKNTEAEKKYAEAINKIASNISEKINIYSMLVPTQLEFSEKVYSNIQSNQKKTIDEINSMLLPRIKPVDVYSVLQNHTDEYIYYRTDHHWTMLGSYYGYSAFMKAQNKAPASLANFKKYTIDGMFGYLYEQYPNDEIKADTLEWYDTAEPNDLVLTMQSINEKGNIKSYTSPMFDKERKNFSFFFSSDHPYTHIKNRKILNPKTLLVVKDSYASNFVPWCVNNYSDIIMIDPRNYKGNLRDVFNQNKIDDVLILNYIFTTSFEDYCTLMINMFR